MEFSGNNETARFSSYSCNISTNGIIPEQDAQKNRTQTMAKSEAY